MIGEVLGHYFIEEQVGKGAFATVYKGRDLRLKRTVAIKILGGKYLQIDNAFGHLLVEAQAASALNHPNICSLYDIGEEQSFNYVVFEFVEGQTLRTILESGALPTKSAVQCGIDIAEALTHAHAAGVLHQDLKSSNIMVTPSGHAKVIDFGLASYSGADQLCQADELRSSIEEAAWICGTIPYMSPELFHGEAATVQSDLWSFGILLYEMLTGNLPFTGRTPFELSTEIMLGEVKSLPQHTPAGLRGIVQRCLAKNKARRYNSALELLDHLRAEFESFPRVLVLCRPPRLRRRG